jgi:two-component system, cell cycle response regulator DivK
VSGEAVIVVDDNAINLKLLRLVLAEEDFDVRFACDAEEVLSLLESFAPRVILMDLQLPGMDGLELTRRLKAAPETRGIIIIAITSYAMKGDRERALASGCDDYVTKPIDVEALPLLVRRHLARN